jgi:hypothetical protein
MRVVVTADGSIDSAMRGHGGGAGGSRVPAWLWWAKQQQKSQTEEPAELRQK